ncbi:MAG: FAD-binding oxidoreductase [Ilumatobacteraceae bacterium]
MTDKIASRSPWIAQLRPDLAPLPLDGDVTTDVAVVGAGIAGLATAFFLLRDTDSKVLLIERDRAGRGATGHNAGQLTTYFERPLFDLVDSYGFDKVIAAQRGIDNSWDLLDTMVADSNAQVRIDRFTGYLGMFALDHLMVHLRDSSLRERGGLRVGSCVVSEAAEFLGDIAPEYAHLYSVVTPAIVRELLDTTDDHYCAVLSGRTGAINGALLIEQVLTYLMDRFDDRFQYVDQTSVRHIDLHSTHATLDTGDHRVTSGHVVMCTNGFVDHVIDNRVGTAVTTHLHHHVSGRVGYMAAFIENTVRTPTTLSYIRNAIIGDSTPYVYVTRRPYDQPAGPATLTCIGGPEAELDNRASYIPDAEFPATILDEIDTDILPLVDSTRTRGGEYDYAWHGLMAYTESKVRLIGFEPRNPVLMYNLGCNGVGFLPSIFGGHRVARLLAGDVLESSIFDPI